jgi:dienelactone hydrolase
MQWRILGFLFVPLLLSANFAMADSSPEYAEHLELTYVLDQDGTRRAVETISDWQQRRVHILQNVQQVMGPLPQSEKPVPLEATTLSETQLPGLIRRKVAYHTDSPDAWVHAWLFLPTGSAGRRPAVLCLHQTVTIGKDEPAGLGGSPNLHYGLELARRGFVTLMPDYPSFGEYDYSFEGDYPSGSMKAIYDNVRAVDFLQSLPVVEPDHIGCIGHSLGGHNSIFTAVFEPRIRVVVSCCGFTRFHKYMEGDLTGWTGPRYMPRIASCYGSHPDQVPFDFTELIGALAPRPFLAVAPLHDGNFNNGGVRDVMDAASPIYALYGNPEALVSDYPDCEHDFPPQSRQRAYDFLAQHLESSSAE